MDNLHAWKDHLPAAAAAFVEDRGLDMIDCVTPDLAGLPRGQIMPASAFEQTQLMILPQHVLTHSFGTQSLAARGAGNAGVTFRADMATAVPLPWTQSTAIEVLFDPLDQDGQLSGVSPRQVLRRVHDHFSEQGWSPFVAADLAFCLTDAPTDGDNDIAPAKGPFGSTSVQPQPFLALQGGAIAQVIEDVLRFATLQGLNVTACASATGPSQFQISTGRDTPIHVANELFRCKRLIRQAAQRHGLAATFLAAPVPDASVSSLRLRFGLQDNRTGRSLLSEPDGTLLHRFIGGLQAHLPSARPLVAPYDASAQSGAPPTQLDWGTGAREAALSVDTGYPHGGHVDSQVAMADSNPYLAIAATLGCGYLGLVEGRSPITDADRAEAPQIPARLRDGLARFEDAFKLRMILGEDFAKAFEATKAAECDDAEQIGASFVRDHLFFSV